MLNPLEKTGCQMQVQRVYLADVGCASLVLGVSASALCIELQGSDLAGHVAVGTCMSVFGTAALTYQPDGNVMRAWTDLQVTNIFIPEVRSFTCSHRYNHACRLHEAL